ncbi:MAG: acyl--CoA ligase, partial [Nitrospinae bacterium]|nr:acyl--CoA ligase [Nitrospinota bacterium]
NTPPFYTSAICHFLTLLAAGGGMAATGGFQFGDGLLAEIGAKGCTGFGGAPVSLIRALAALDSPCADRRLSFWVSSGDRLPVRYFSEIDRKLPGVTFFYLYGLTEVSGRLCVMRRRKGDVAKAGSVGAPLPGMAVTVRDETGALLPPGETGEVHVSGDLLMEGYLDRPDLSACSLTPHGFKTGDLGRLDADGDLWIEGRLDDMVKVGGEKVSTTQVEEALRATGLFADVAAVAVEDEAVGRSVAAFVVPRDGGSFKRVAVMKELRTVLPPASVPSRIVPVETIPRTGSGKVERGALRSLMCGEGASS